MTHVAYSYIVYIYKYICKLMHMYTWYMYNEYESVYELHYVNVFVLCHF